MFRALDLKGSNPGIKKGRRSVLLEFTLSALLRNRFRDLGERLGISHRDVGKHLTIEADIGGFQIVDQSAVGRAVHPRCRIDAGDPQSPEITLPGAAVAVGIPKALQHGLVCSSEEIMPGAIHPLGHFQYLLVTLAGNLAAFNSGHFSHSCEPWAPTPLRLLYAPNIHEST